MIRVDDVTERVRMEEMMIQSAKMLSVGGGGGLAAGMAHEINNPLAGILQNTAVLKNHLTGDLPANPKAAEAAGTTMATIQTYSQQRKLLVMIENIIVSGNRAATITKFMSGKETTCEAKELYSCVALVCPEGNVSTGTGSGCALTLQFNRFDQHPSRALVIKPQSLGCSGAQIDDAVADKRSAIVDPDDNAALVGKVCYPDEHGQGQEFVGGTQSIRIEGLTVGGHMPAVLTVGLIAIP